MNETLEPDGRLYMGNCWVVWMDWVLIGKGLIYMAKWAFLKLLGKLRGLWEMNEIGREGNWVKELI